MAEKDDDAPATPETDDAGPGQTPPDPAPKDDSGSSGKTFTQEDINRIAATEARKAEKAALRKLAEEAGVENAAELIDLAKTKAAEAEAEKTELQKALDQLDAAKADVELARAEANATTLRSTLTQKLLAGQGDDVPSVRPERLDAALALALPAVPSDEDDIDTAVATAIAHAHSTVPELFGNSGGPTGSGPATPPPPGRPPSQQNGSSSSSTSAEDEARRMLERVTKPGTVFGPSSKSE